MALNSGKNAWQSGDVESRGWLETSIRCGYMTTVMWQVAHSNKFSRIKHLYICHIWTGGSDFRRLSNKIEQFPRVCKQMQVHACNLLVWVVPNIVWYGQFTVACYLSYLDGNERFEPKKLASQADAFMASSRVSPPRTFVWDDCMTSQKNVCVGGYSQYWQHLYQSKHWCDNQSLVMILIVRKNCLKRCMITLMYILPGVSDKSISRQVLSVCECSIGGFVPSSWSYGVFRHRESKIAIEHLILHSE